MSGHSVRSMAGLTAVLFVAATGVSAAAEPDAVARIGDPVKLVAEDDDAAKDIWFGDTVDVDGDTMVVGAECAPTKRGGCDGAAYVFVRSGSTWTQQAKLVSSDLDKHDHFGSAVAISGDTIVVGSPEDTSGGLYFWHGSAYVFTRSGETWTERAKLTAPFIHDFDRFGTSVAIDGPTIVVGTPYRDGADFGSGAAYVFERAGNSWPRQAELLAEDGDINDQFAWSVAVHGDTVLAGAPATNPAGKESGSAYAFVRTGSTWQQAAHLVAGDARKNARFGTAVALDGTTAAIGNGHEGSVRSGVYVFTGAGSSWSQQAKLTGRSGDERNEFGTTVDVSGKTIAVGAMSEDGTSFDSGAAYVFKRKGTTWKQRARLTADLSGVEDRLLFGSDVAVDGKTVVVGHRGEDEVYAY